MKILLIFSHIGPKRPLFNKFLLPSSTLEQIASTIPEKHEIELLDERFENVDLNWEGDLVGISCFTYCANHAYQIADAFRRRGKIVVLGGYHPSALPKEAKQHADAVVIGEAEISLPRLLTDLEKGNLQPFYKSNLVNPEKIPPPVRINKNNCFMTAVQATRGCPNNCNFCSIHNIEGSIFRARPIENVVKEISSISEKKIFFTDSSLTTNPKYTKALFTQLKDFNKQFDCAGNVNILSNDNEFLKLASEAGVKQWHVGFESISQENINNMGKKSNKIKEYASAVRKIKDNGMMVIGLFMFGFDDDKPDVFDSTLEAISQWDLDHARFSILTPYPGTRICDKLALDGRILSKDWSLYDSDHVVIKPKNMTSRGLYEGTQYSIKQFYSFSNLIKNTVNTTNLDFQDYLTKNWRSFFTTLFYRY